MNESPSPQDFLSSMAKLLQYSIPGTSAPIEERRVARDKVDGFCISTCYTDDQGYETALAGNDGNWHPVERYSSYGEAQAGHAKWVQFIRDGHREITQLGYDGIVDPEQITLQ